MPITFLTTHLIFRRNFGRVLDHSGVNVFLKFGGVKAKLFQEATIFCGFCHDFCLPALNEQGTGHENLKKNLPDNFRKYVLLNPIPTS